MLLKEAKEILERNGYRLNEFTSGDDDTFDWLTEIIYQFFKDCDVNWESSWKRDNYEIEYKGIYDYFTEIPEFGKVKLKIFNGEVTGITFSNKDWYSPSEFNKILNSPRKKHNLLLKLSETK